MDLVSVALLSLFAAAGAGGVVGVLVGRFTRFEVGLAVALLVVGAVALGFAVRCFLEYRDFAYAGANAAWGEVIAIEDRPVNESGSVTSPVPVVRFTAPDQSSHVVRGPSGGSAKLGSHVNVIYDARDPQRSRIGDITELRGGAIAMLLFGTFLASFGIWLSCATRGKRHQVPARGKRARSIPMPASERTPAAAAPRSRGRTAVLVALNVALFGAVLWIGLAPGDLQQNFAEGFAAVAVVCAGYAAWGRLGGGTSFAWQAGMLVLAVNFGVWAFALSLLS